MGHTERRLSGAPSIACSERLGAFGSAFWAMPTHCIERSRSRLLAARVNGTSVSCPT
jgi:hypothetical protein